MREEDFLKLAGEKLVQLKPYFTKLCSTVSSAYEAFVASNSNDLERGNDQGQRFPNLEE